MRAEADTDTPLAAKVARLLPLLGSDSPGEVVAAAGAIGRVLGSAGRDWHDLAERLCPGTAPGVSRTAPAHPGMTPPWPRGCPTWRKLSHPQRLAWFDVVWCKVRLTDHQTRDLETFEAAYRSRGVDAVTRERVSCFNKAVNAAWMRGARV